MTDVPPEIEKLRMQGFDAAGRRAGDPDYGPVGMRRVWLSDAEAAVLACEQRMKHDLLDRDLEATALRAERDSERQRTVAEIVEALREHAAHLGNVEGRYYASAANYVEQRFGGKEGERMPDIRFDNATTVREIAYRCAAAGSAAVMRLAPDVVMPAGEIGVAVEEILCDFWPEAAVRPEGDDDSLDHHGDTSDA